MTNVSVCLLETIKPEENQQWGFRETESIIVIHSQTLNLSSCKLILSLWFLSLILDGGVEWAEWHQRNSNVSYQYEQANTHPLWERVWMTDEKSPLWCRAADGQFSSHADLRSVKLLKKSFQLLWMAIKPFKEKKEVKCPVTSDESALSFIRNRRTWILQWFIMLAAVSWQFGKEMRVVLKGQRRWWLLVKSKN